LGTMTTFRAEGASFLMLVSPPGWYWYGPSPPDCFHGSLCSALATARSEEALVGERAGVDVSTGVRRWVGSSPRGPRTEVPACKTEDAAHDGHEHLKPN